MIKKILIPLHIFFITCVCFSQSDSLNALDVLNAYQKAIEKSSLLHVEKSAHKGYVRLEHISSTFITPTNIQQDKYTSETNYIFLYDHGLVDYHQTMKIFEGDQISVETKAQYLLDNEAGYQYGTRLNIPPPYIDVFNSDRWEIAVTKLGIVGKIFEGYFDGDSLTPIWEVLKEESDLKLRDEMEVIDGYETYVLEAKVPNRGEYTLWIDPNYGFNLRRCVVRRSDNDLFFGKPLNTPPKQPPGPEYGPMQYPDIKRIVTLDSVRIDNLSENFIPVEGTATIYIKESNGNESTAKYIFKRSEIDFDPDFDKFENAFVLDVPNGTRVRFRDSLDSGTSFMWQDGKVVSINIQPELLIGKPLPELKDYGIKSIENDKKLLICFFDMEQRPSRNCIIQLNKRIQELKEKEIAIAAIHASEIEKEKINEWIKGNDISLTVGMIQDNEDKARENWGIQSLPWLILTDKNHIVIDEGFSIDEIDEKINDLK